MEFDKRELMTIQRLQKGLGFKQYSLGVNFGEDGRDGDRSELLNGFGSRNLGYQIRYNNIPDLLIPI